MSKNKRKIYRRPNKLLFGFARIISQLLCRFVYKLKVVRNDLEDRGGRCVIIANHESVIDVLPAIATVPMGTHFVVSRAMMKSMPIAPFMEMCGAIDKNQFQTSPLDMRRMKAVLDHGEPLMIYPAGLMSESGASTPIPPATARVLKWFKSDVYVARVHGTYLTDPKWARVRRRGEISIEIYKLATEDELAALSDDDAATLVTDHLSFDAYRENEQRRVYYKNGDNIEGLEGVLYKCPSCEGEFTIRPRDRRFLLCQACGYSVKSDNFGMLSSACKADLVYKYPSDWHAYIERSVYKFVCEHQGFYYETPAQVFTINEKKHRYECLGNGVVGFDINNFYLDVHLRKGRLIEKIPTGAFPILPFRPGRYFEIQHADRIYRILPDHPIIVMKWIFTLKACFRLKQENYQK